MSGNKLKDEFYELNELKNKDFFDRNAKFDTHYCFYMYTFTILTIKSFVHIFFRIWAFLSLFV